MDGARGRGLLGIGLYTVSEAARLLSFSARMPITPRRLGRWINGYKWYDPSDRSSGPVVPSDIILANQDVISFAVFCELLVVCAFLREGLRLPIIRAAHEVARNRYKDAHPFALGKFYTNGKDILRQLSPEEIDPRSKVDRVIEEIDHSQVVFDRFILPYYRDMDYVKDFAARFWPLGKASSIVIDPERAFGKPIENRTGVPTFALYGPTLAGEAPKAIADWFGVPVRGVNDAIKYEAALRKAA